MTMSSGEGIGQEENGPDALFRLATIKGAAAAQRVGEAAAPQEDAAADSPSSSDGGGGPADEDSDDARRWARLVLRLGLCLRLGRALGRPWMWCRA